MLAGTPSSKKLYLKDMSLPTVLSAFRLNPASHAKKKTSKTPHEADFPAISSPVWSNTGEKFAS